ncbi:adenylyl cyclase-associated protein [Gregarina niphandrodes]|uniref:Adenylyl cyclase-associated protein n=1 Tax=Gregarina niphandrodes TaxID=110365 RepID=A0A023AZU5_GRENI|nr:adenylyl cyclase-associated protein [Gregarina niphandrodes]EZG44379.1 adenylyl cyclase-associated protein [Gregarina niphandrodes]|eukprot:XP_011132694.1 adenylyl cyclase-associated protein [Gregarina niphandrodes]
MSSITFKEPNRYFIENVKDEEVVLGGENGEHQLAMRHAVMISKCHNAVIHLKGKCNKVELDHCTKVTVIVPAVVSSVDMQKSASCEIHVEQRCPGISIDDCNSMSIYVPRDSMEFIEVASSGGGSANLFVPTEEDPTEFKEYPIPFQFVHKFKGSKLVSEVSPLYTH